MNTLKRWGSFMLPAALPTAIAVAIFFAIKMASFTDGEVPQEWTPGNSLPPGYSMKTIDSLRQATITSDSTMR